MNAQQIISLIVSWLTQAVSIALLLLIACAVAGVYGVRVPMLPRIDGTALAWLTGAWWLWRGGRI
jgi:hypothetical protein